LIYPLKVVILHSYLSLPEGIGKMMIKHMTFQHFRIYIHIYIYTIIISLFSDSPGVSWGVYIFLSKAGKKVMEEQKLGVHQHSWIVFQQELEFNQWHGTGTSLFKGIKYFWPLFQEHVFEQPSQDMDKHQGMFRQKDRRWCFSVK
jgi:hypothetical protein